MRFWIKAGVTGVMAAAAVLSAVWALRSISVKAEAAPPAAYEWSCDEADAEFVLREYSGYVGVFASGGAKSPLTVTNIPVANLREADRDMLGAGIAVADRGELLTLLEDLGS